MKRRRKTNDCLNCGYPLQADFEYCPKCGQENHTTTISFGKLITDFLHNYFSLDSRFGRSIRPFFLKPGKLTSEFIAGKRMNYANPIRLYLVISLIHFFVLSLYIGKDVDERPKKGIINTTDDEKEKKSGPIQFNLSDNPKKEALDSLDEDDDSWPISGEEYLLIQKMSDSGNFTNKEILDSLKANEKPFFQRYAIRQIVKMQGSDQYTIQELIIKNIPMLMFFLLPIYALILKVFFRKRLYILHLIHSLHVHSFAFLTLTIYWTIGIFSDSMRESSGMPFFLLNTIYLILSFKNTYQVKVLTAVFKVFFSGFIYMIVLSFGFILEVLISFLFY